MIDYTEDIENCLSTLHSGGIILYPTDTSWGLGCDATNSDAVQRLITLKGKNAGDGFIVLLANERDILYYVANPDLAVFDYLDNIQQPTSIIYPNGLHVADDVLNKDGSIGIRLVKEDFCRTLLKRFKKPVVSTSANYHGQSSPQNFTQISENLTADVDYVVKIKRSENAIFAASSIVKWVNGQPVKIR